MRHARPGSRCRRSEARGMCIRDAALRLFRAEGVAGTGIRDVAREAGVSSGLVQHYYRSKEVLRAACDAYRPLADPVRIKEQLVLEGGLENPAFLGDSHPELPSICTGTWPAR